MTTFVAKPEKDLEQAQENKSLKKKNAMRVFYNRVVMKIHSMIDARYDRVRGIETCELAYISDLDDDPVDFSGFFIDELYGALPIRLFNAIHRPGNILSRREATYVDIGAGKARMLILAAERGFKKILGIEYVPSLAQTGVRNCEIALKHMNDVTWANDVIDGTTMKYPDTNLLVFVNNSFDRPMFDDWLNNLLDDLRKNPREMILIYNHSICSHVLDATPELERVRYGLLDRLYINLLNPHPYGAWRYINKGPQDALLNKTSVLREPEISKGSAIKAA